MFIIWLICASVFVTKIECMPNTTAESGSDGANSDLEKLKTAENTQKLEIIKQIKRINSDGSYTVGYEADDGTFKIESRDVLGNVKGTYGYVDEHGEIKRVSYVTNNSSTGIKTTTTAKPTTVDDVVHIPPRQNRSLLATASTTRRPPSLAYLTNTAATTIRSNVIQPIPKRRILLSATDRPHFKNQYSSVTRQGDYLTSTSTTRKTDPTTTIVYATSVPQKKTTNIRPIPSPGSTVRTMMEQNKGNKVEIADRFSKVHIEKHGQTSKEKPVTEESDEKEPQTERKPLRGNFLRRQLSEDNHENFEAQQQVIYSQSTGEDNSHIYGGVTGVIRPLYSTTSSPRIPALVLAARSRAAQLQNTLTSTPQTTSTTEKVYSKPPRRKTERREDEEPTTEPTSEHNYITQSPIPVQIPPNRDASQATEGDRVYKRPIAYLARSRDFVRQIPNSQYRSPVQQLYAQQHLENEQYLRETTSPTDKETSSQYTNGNPAQAGAYLPRDENRPYLPPQHPSNGYEQQQSYPIPVPPLGAPYYGPGSASHAYNNPDRPLTARDFERLLNLLILRHQQVQRYGNYLPGGGSPYPYGGPGGGGGGGYNPYLPFYYQQIPRPPLYQPPYDPRYGQYNRFGPPALGPPNYYGPSYSEQENMYQAQNPVANKQVPYTDQRFAPRRKLYDPQLIGGPQAAFYGDRPEYGDESQQQPAQTEYLPPDIREELLYRMLMLAIQPESNNNAPTPDSGNMLDYIKPSGTTTASTPAVKSKKPVRSVQILGEE